MIDKKTSFARLVSALRMPILTCGTFIFIGLFTGLFTGQPLTAQEIVQRIEALVNDEVISAYDLQQRMGLVVAATGGVRNQEELQRMAEQVLRSMVDEQLQIQEAASFDLIVEDGDLQDAFERVARNTGQSPVEFERTLLQFGSSKRSLLGQLRAEFVWQELVRGRLGALVSISDEDVEQTIAQLEADRGKYEYRLAEIYMIVDIPSRDEFVRQRTQRLVSQLREGAQFPAVARQFSESATAARGGDLGWMSESQMTASIGAAVAKLELLGISDPIRSAGGYYIIQVRDRRRILSVDALDKELEIHQIAYPFTESSTEETVGAWIKSAQEASKGINSCEQIPTLAATLGVETFGSAGYVSLRDLGPQLRELLEPLAKGTPSMPITTPESILLFFVCGERQPEVTSPSFDAVFDQLQQQRLAMMARRYLRDLRRDAIIDYKQ